jgi:hypothetical protein
VRVQKNLLEKWVSPAKGTIAKVLANKYCSKTKGKFLIQLVKDVAAQDIIGELPTDLTPIEVPTIGNIQEPSLVNFGGSFCLPKFSASKEWCLMAEKAIESIGLFQVELSFFECVDQGACVTRVTIPTARYLALGKSLKNY